MDPLEDVLAVECEIADRIGAERANAARWLEERKREIDEAAEAERASRVRLEAANDDAARKAGAAKAAAIVEQANSFATRLQSIDDARLEPIVRKHLAFLVPGANR